jgi:hypothetical protein
MWPCNTLYQHGMLHAHPPCLNTCLPCHYCRPVLTSWQPSNVISQPSAASNTQPVAAPSVSKTLTRPSPLQEQPQPRAQLLLPALLPQHHLAPRNLQDQRMQAARALCQLRGAQQRRRGVRHMMRN